MSAFFLHDRSTEWRVCAPEKFPVALIPDPLDVVACKDSGHRHRRPPSVHRAAPVAERAEFLLLAPPGCTVWVNQSRVFSGLRVLRHRDAIRIGRAPTLYFTTERLARVETFAGSDEPTHCPRCRSEILPNDAVVRCPGCQVAMHEIPAEKRGCWSYSPTCCVCGGSTDFTAGYQWHPGSL